MLSSTKDRAFLKTCRLRGQGLQNASSRTPLLVSAFYAVWLSRSFLEWRVVVKYRSWNGVEVNSKNIEMELKCKKISHSTLNVFLGWCKNMAQYYQTFRPGDQAVCMRFYNSVDEKLQHDFIINVSYCITKACITNISNIQKSSVLHHNRDIFYDKIV